MTPLLSGMVAYATPAASARIPAHKNSKRLERRPMDMLKTPLETVPRLRFMALPLDRSSLLIARAVLDYGSHYFQSVNADRQWAVRPRRRRSFSTASRPAQRSRRLG